MNCNPPDSFVHGIFQARILQWAAISFSRRSSWLRNRTHISWIGRQILYCLSHMGRPIYYDSCLNWHLHNLRCVCCYLVAKSCLTLCNPLDCSMLGFPVLHYLLEWAQTCPLSRWCHPTILSSVTPFSCCPHSFPASGSFPMRWLFSSGSQSIAALASVLPMSMQVDFL